MITLHAYERTCRQYGILTATFAAIIIVARELFAFEL